MGGAGGENQYLAILANTGGGSAQYCSLAAASRRGWRPKARPKPAKAQLSMAG